MKKVTLLLMLALAFNLSNAQGKGIFNYGQRISTTPISSIKATAGASMYFTGLGNIKTRAIMIGATSRNKTHADSLSFVMNFGAEAVDDFSSVTSMNVNSPNDLLLFRLEKKPNQRRLLIGTMGVFSGAAIGMDSSKSIDFEVKSLGDGKYRVTLPNTTRNGEYGFVHSQYTGLTTRVWAFTVENSRYISAERMAEIDKKRAAKQKLEIKEAKKAAKKEAKKAAKKKQLEAI